RVDARERLGIFHLAWDLSSSSFGSRQMLYERFFFGDPVRMAGALVQGYDRQRYIDLAHRMLDTSVVQGPDHA
ncbi:MAG: 4-hydroxyphenylacetate 3-hydroxylase C-terminal domain-containing protein, partial [Sulfobacillus sp.]